MPVYDYSALDKKGKKIRGIIDADSEGAARAKLRGRNIFPVGIVESNRQSRKEGRRSLSLFANIKSAEVNAVIRQLATLLGAGVPLVQALGSLSQQTGNIALQKVIAQIKDEVNEGNSLTEALARHPRLFSSVFINMVRAGEASGSLDIVLDRLAEFGENQEILKAKVRAALIYPLFMAVIGGLILFVLITYIVPNITQVFAEMNRTLPLPTLVLINLSDVLKHFWWLILASAMVLFFWLRYVIGQPAGRRVYHFVKLKVWVVGPVVRKIILARFASTLGSLLESGVGLMDSMRIVKNLVDNVHVAGVIETSMDDVRKGKSMTLALRESPWFPPMFVQMIEVGEQSGSLEQMLQKVSKMYEKEVEISIVAMTSIIEPTMIALMGVAVGFVVLSILLPIFEMNQLVG
ncbi:type II secretion system inner membrane protein GspF [Desulforhopalus singaporensis]|uniref:General secretion pathway protein F n=1 Tax=Desulforhopalus singaporensis TaxID=91360 RepID=A0A1H0M2M4_9BACT|nr:type II secretion system inner membrane protein GspF [Desulforhopalus singaporensis]SDO74541.1 general secretion pathway protein F [Desulforhopalus singaporensis]